jgi:hypothetical protein
MTAGLATTHPDRGRHEPAHQDTTQTLTFDNTFRSTPSGCDGPTQRGVSRGISLRANRVKPCDLSRVTCVEAGRLTRLSIRRSVSRQVSAASSLGRAMSKRRARSFVRLVAAASLRAVAWGLRSVAAVLSDPTRWGFHPKLTLVLIAEPKTRREHDALAVGVTDDLERTAGPLIRRCLLIAASN